ncbi:MAG: hypothetical protein KI786_15040 [Mameliella sp.]|nr:hypothetical protein [Phaeodactylibacter sp.]
MSEFNQVIKEGASTVGNWIKRFFFILLTLAILGGAGYLWVCNWTYSQGTRAGTLIKISNKGVVFKTYEGQLNLGGFRQNASDGLTGNIWEFSVWEDDIYDQLQNFEGKQVKLYYREKYKSMPWQGDTNYFIYQVEEVK